jgi:hypothetical protein
MHFLRDDVAPADMRTRNPQVGAPQFQYQRPVDYVTAEHHHAAQWNDHVPASLTQALPRIWPPLATQQDLLWPLQAFAANDWDQLVTWDGALRGGTDGG